jgi:PAS domain S-box-containing protein
MKVRSYLRINVVLSFLVPFLVGILLIYAYNAGGRELQESREVSALGTTLGELHETLNKIALSAKPIIDRAWRDQFQLLQGELKNVHLEDGREQRILQRMREAARALADLAPPRETAPGEEQIVLNRRKIPHIEESLLKLQGLAVSLIVAIHGRLEARYHVVGVGASAAALGLTLLLAGLSIPNERRLVPRLKNVEQGIRRIAAGDFGRPLDDLGRDELGDLARAFDDLAAQQGRTLGALRASESKYRTLVENLPQRVYLKNLNLDYVSCNELFAADLGIDPDRLGGKSDFDLFPRAVAEKTRLQDREVLNRGEMVETRERDLVDEQEVWIDTIRTPIRNEAGKVVGLLGVAWDITGTVVAEAQVKRLAEILENTPDYVSTSDAEGHITWINPAGLQMLGLPPGQTPSHLTVRDTHPEWAGRLIGNVGFPTALREGIWTGENALLGHDGREVPVLQVILSHKDPSGAVLYCSTIARDLTERKAAEEKIRTLNRGLEQRVAQRTAELEEAVADLKRSNRELEQFAYVASHDLQEPLRMVGSYVQLLARRYRGNLDADADEFIGYAVEGATRMQELINDLLALSRVGRREDPFVVVDCNEVLASTLRNLQKVLEETGGSVIHSRMPSVLGVPSQVGQVFQNLLGNALKFRGERPPEIEISAVREGTFWIFAFRDNGIGIDSRYFDRIFVIFQRLHGKQDYPGTGIGLALTRKIVERHGGRIWVESQPGRGSTFFFTLKGAEQPHEPERLPHQDSAG